MNKIFIFALILLATLSMTNAVSIRLRKRATTFNSCLIEGTSPLNVTITPDPIVVGKTESFSVLGILTNDVTSSTQLVIIFADSNNNALAPPYIQPASSTLIKAGTQFTVNAQQVPVPATLPQDYRIIAILGDPTNDSTAPLRIYGCTFTTALFTAALNDQSTADSISGVVESTYPIVGGPSV